MAILGLCGSCAHWRAQKGKGGVLLEVSGNTPGECHAHPPVPLFLMDPSGALTIQTLFPMPHSNMDCAEHKLKDC